MTHACARSTIDRKENEPVKWDNAKGKFGDEPHEYILPGIFIVIWAANFQQ